MNKTVKIEPLPPRPPLRKSQGEKLREKYFRTLAARPEVDKQEAQLSATRVEGRRVRVFERQLTEPKRVLTA